MPVNNNKQAENETQGVTAGVGREESEAQKKPLAEKTTEELLSLLQEKEEEARANYDRMLRQAAELENYKKRAEKEKAEHIRYANEALVKDLLPVLDNLERALEHAKDDNTDKQGLRDGVQMIFKEYQNVMERFGLKAVDTSGKTFDPQYHEAVMVEESDTADENTILNVLQKGYMFQDRLLRPAMVIVSRRPPEKASDT